MLKIVFALIIISLIIITPQAFAQLSIGIPAEHVSIKVTIEENGDVHVVHTVKKNTKIVQIQMLSGTVENIQVTDGIGNEIQHAISGNSIITLFPPKTNFVVEYDLKDVLILKDGVWTWDFLYTKSENGVEFYFPDKVDLVFVNDRPVRIISAEGMRCHGCQMKNLEYVINEPIILKEIEWEKQKFLISIMTLDEINSFNFDQPERRLSFENTQEDKFFTVIIPLELLWNPYDVYLDGEKILNRELYLNDTHVWLNFKPKTTGTIEIIGVSAIPEFSLLLPLVLGITIVVGLQAKNKITHH